MHVPHNKKRNEKKRHEKKEMVSSEFRECDSILCIPNRNRNKCLNTFTKLLLIRRCRKEFDTSTKKKREKKNETTEKKDRDILNRT